jgi:putative heme utilization carrier protein HutX
MSNNDNGLRLPGSDALGLLQELASWGNTTTIILRGGCVFEFKGPFPAGSMAEGYYNLDGPVPGFHGHIRLEAIESIGLQQRPHRGRDSYAFTFDNAAGENLFKVFLGRDQAGEVIPAQLRAFQAIRDNLLIGVSEHA